METSLTNINRAILRKENMSSQKDNNHEEQRFEGGFRHYRNVRHRIKGEFPFYPELVVGGYVEDLFELTDSDVREALLINMLEPVKVSIKAIKNNNDKRIKYEIRVAEISDPLEICILTLPRSKMTGLRAWIEKEFGGYQGVDVPVFEYLEQAIEELAPILEREAFAMYEKDGFIDVYCRIIAEVKSRVRTREEGNDSKYQINTIEEKGDFVCIKGKVAFNNLLMSIEADYQVLELLKKFDAMGLLLVNSGRHYDFRFDGGWWYVIRIDRNMIKKGEVTGNYE